MKNMTIEEIVIMYDQTRDKIVMGWRKGEAMNIERALYAKLTKRYCELLQRPIA